MSAPASTQATGALDRCLEAFDRERIGARHDDEIRIASRASTAALMRSTISSLRHDLLAGTVAAALGAAPGLRCACRPRRP